MNTPIILEPLYMERVWGGRTLESKYGRTLPGDAPYGESWEVVDRKDAQSVVKNGPLAGKTLRELWLEDRDVVFGAVPDSERFPLLVKILDARDRLSIQVHPPASVAAELGGEPKTEMWYIAAAEPGAKLYVGMKAGVSAEDFERGIAEGKTESQVHEIHTKAGEFIFIPSGRLHAIGAGLLIFEIQQNSDTTYRVFDWNRLGLDGKPRDLHVAESLKCIDFSDYEPTMDTANGEVITDCDLFRVERWELNGARACGAVGDFSIVSVIDGVVECGGCTFCEGDFFIVPAAMTAGARVLAPANGSSASVLRTTIPKAS
jgi:mannose-6-phosphate isomerase